MKKYLALLPLFLVTACGYSLFDAADDVSNMANGDLDDGSPIGADWAATGEFDRLSASGSDDVRFVTGEVWRIRAEGDADVLDRLRYKVENGRIRIGRESGNWGGNGGKATVYVTAPAISAAALSGSGGMTIDRIGGEEVKLAISGSGNLTADRVEAKTLKTSISGSGDMKLAGRAAQSRFSVAGSGDIDGARFDAGNARVSIAGSGDVGFASDGEVKASIAGSGDVNVTGSAKCTSSVAGSGKLRCAG